MHFIPRQRKEIINVEFKNRVFEVTLDGDAYVPNDLAQHMIAKGLVAKGFNPDPRPRWERNSDGSHGELIPMFSPWVKELSPEQAKWAVITQPKT
jgi:hypothetical protein